MSEDKIQPKQTILLKPEESIINVPKICLLPQTSFSEKEKETIDHLEDYDYCKHSYRDSGSFDCLSVDSKVSLSSQIKSVQNWFKHLPGSDQIRVMSSLMPSIHFDYMYLVASMAATQVTFIKDEVMDYDRLEEEANNYEYISKLAHDPSTLAINILSRFPLLYPVSPEMLDPSSVNQSTHFTSMSVHKLYCKLLTQLFCQEFTDVDEILAVKQLSTLTANHPNLQSQIKNTLVDLASEKGLLDEKLSQSYCVSASTTSHSLIQSSLNNQHQHLSSSVTAKPFKTSINRPKRLGGLSTNLSQTHSSFSLLAPPYLAAPSNCLSASASPQSAYSYNSSSGFMSGAESCGRRTQPPLSPQSSTTSSCAGDEPPNEEHLTDDLMSSMSLHCPIKIVSSGSCGLLSSSLLSSHGIYKQLSYGEASDHQSGSIHTQSSIDTPTPSSASSIMLVSTTKNSSSSASSSSTTCNKSMEASNQVISPVFNTVTSTALATANHTNNTTNNTCSSSSLVLSDTTFGSQSIGDKSQHHQQHHVYFSTPNAGQLNDSFDYASLRSLSTSSQSRDEDTDPCTIDHTSTQPPMNTQSHTLTSISHTEFDRNTFRERGSGMASVPSWLKSLRLHKYASLFQTLSYEEMINITDEWLDSKNVTKGARNKILVNIQKLESRHTTLRQLETDLMTCTSGGGGSACALRALLTEVRHVLTTPIRPVSATVSSESGSEALAGLGDIGSAGPDDLPALIIRCLGRACSQLLLLYQQPLEEELYSQFMSALDSIIEHDSFSSRHKSLCRSWRIQLDMSIGSHSSSMSGCNMGSATNIYSGNLMGIGVGSGSGVGSNSSCVRSQYYSGIIRWRGGSSHRNKHHLTRQVSIANTSPAIIPSSPTQKLYQQQQQNYTAQQVGVRESNPSYIVPSQQPSQSAAFNPQSFCSDVASQQPLSAQSQATSVGGNGPLHHQVERTLSAPNQGALMDLFMHYQQQQHGSVGAPASILGQCQWPQPPTNQASSGGSQPVSTVVSAASTSTTQSSSNPSSNKLQPDSLPIQNPHSLYIHQHSHLHPQHQLISHYPTQFCNQANNTGTSTGSGNTGSVLDNSLPTDGSGLSVCGIAAPTTTNTTSTSQSHLQPPLPASSKSRPSSTTDLQSTASSSVTSSSSSSVALASSALAIAQNSSNIAPAVGSNDASPNGSQDPATAEINRNLDLLAREVTELAIRDPESPEGYKR